jgi:uncharacterized membrane protein YphA (DoxX/SURF4 family)
LVISVAVAIAGSRTIVIMVRVAFIVSAAIVVIGLIARVVRVAVGLLIRVAARAVSWSRFWSSIARRRSIG